MSAQDLLASGVMSRRRALALEAFKWILHWAIIAALLAVPVAWVALVLKVTLWPL